ncbi:ATP-dependent zinc protease [Photobacterium sp. TY1-4]|uniref:ATP-dependent zinc protease family protein n=1 Tax=Photobacterium sp. TY1-4 TaxID=2899122 RepID=UPI0021C0719E|nr:ATP-dependent zinc protease [Photobacterium sp. TY1-4]UXI03857.1 ATP-dependent zinc protease [Photobacterium sp. TY1-4]
MKTTQTIVGWREWLALPALGISSIKAKVDTGAKTSALHAFIVNPYQKDGEDWVQFFIHPWQNDTNTVVECHARLCDQRQVTDSGGHREMRYVIQTEIALGDEILAAEITLTDRESMKFRMLLGRNVLKQGFMVDSARSFLLGRKLSHH